MHMIYYINQGIKHMHPLYISEGRKYKYKLYMPILYLFVHNMASLKKKNAHVVFLEYFPLVLAFNSIFAFGLVPDLPPKKHGHLSRGEVWQCNWISRSPRCKKTCFWRHCHSANDFWSLVLWCAFAGPGSPKNLKWDFHYFGTVNLLPKIFQKRIAKPYRNVGYRKNNPKCRIFLVDVILQDNLKYPGHIQRVATCGPKS